ncbi:hypothetical protein CB599_11650 [Salmonella enterica subsp. enterica serovar Adjame]|nr:hypothetical protein [Salmonella enterica subsp. enterica serovar Adjame]
MHNEVIFQQKFIYDPTSPTGLRYRKNKKPAGFKNHGGYWVVQARAFGETLTWSIARALFELVHQVELTRALVVVPLDGDYTNFKINNLAAVPMAHVTHKI